MKIKDTLKRNKFIYLFIQIARNIRKSIKVYFKLYLTPSITFNFNRFLRVTRIDRNSPYEKLREIKNKHYGERCFIVATGPSLRIEDLEKLKKEITFSMNTICLAFEETDWRPMYYGIQDENVYKRMEKFINDLRCEAKFISDTIQKTINVNLGENDYLFPLNLLNHNTNHKKYHSKFSEDIFSVVYSGYTITYCLIQIAIYMGFKEIYLLGTDCNYSKDMKHHFKDYDHVDPTYLQAGEMMISAYQVAKEYADNHNINIYNATRGGMLEVFERVDFDSLFSKEVKMQQGIV